MSFFSLSLSFFFFWGRGGFLFVFLLLTDLPFFPLAEEELRKRSRMRTEMAAVAWDESHRKVHGAVDRNNWISSWVNLVRLSAESLRRGTAVVRTDLPGGGGRGKIYLTTLHHQNGFAIEREAVVKVMFMSHQSWGDKVTISVHKPQIWRERRAEADRTEVHLLARLKRSYCRTGSWNDDVIEPRSIYLPD